MYYVHISSIYRTKSISQIQLQQTTMEKVGVIKDNLLRTID